MPLILPGNVASAVAGAYEVANSCRFNDGDSPSMTKTLGTPTSTKIGTFSCWVKLGNITTEQSMLGAYADSSNRHHLEFQADHNIEFFGKASNSTNMSLITNAYYRDPSAWYNVVVAWDTSQGTDSNRVKLYVNGTQVTSFATETYPDQNTVLQFNTDGSTIAIGRNQGGNYADGYLAEVVFIDGTQYAASDFGEFDEDSPTIWKPKDVSGLTFGDEGFYCDMEASDNLGNDANGGTDLTEANLAATDQATDTPTNNFAVLNHLAWTTGSGLTFSEGNLKVANSASDWRPVISTIPVTTGKWYCEIKCTAVGSGGQYGVTPITDYNDPGDLAYNIGDQARTFVYINDGNKENNGSAASYGDTYTTNDIIGIAIDLTNNYIYFSKNGTFQASGDPTSGSSGTNAAYALTDGYYYGFTFATNAGTGEINFGSPPYANSSDAADANGYGAFEYAPPSGYYALCTKNLAEFG